VINIQNTYSSLSWGESIVSGRFWLRIELGRLKESELMKLPFILLADIPNGGSVGDSAEQLQRGLLAIQAKLRATSCSKS
jgi:hypothetical protein